ncbi:MAG: hypothetical protein AAF517_18735, partial [Planctomycetota bacterium]
MSWKLILILTALTAACPAGSLLAWESGIQALEEGKSDEGKVPPAKVGDSKVESAEPKAAPTGDAKSEEPLSFSAEHLEGTDEGRGDFAAAQLLQAAAVKDADVEGDEIKIALRKRHRDWVLERLSVERISEDANPGARRILKQLSFFTEESGPPFPDAPKLLLDLLGYGNDDIRSSVVSALVIVI